jgi:hypothetical protein
MPCSLDFDSKNRILRWCLHGHVTEQELKTTYTKLYEIVVRIQPSAGIVDGSDVTSFEISADLMRLLAKAAPIMPDPALLRVIIAPSPDFYGLARMFEIQGEATRPNLHVVRTEREAFAILAVQDPHFDPVETE